MLIVMFGVILDFMLDVLLGVVLGVMLDGLVVVIFGIQLGDIFKSRDLCRLLWLVFN